MEPEIKLFNPIDFLDKYYPIWNKGSKSDFYYYRFDVSFKFCKSCPEELQFFLESITGEKFHHSKWDSEGKKPINDSWEHNC